MKKIQEKQRTFDFFLHKILYGVTESTQRPARGQLTQFLVQRRNVWIISMNIKISASMNEK